MDTNGWASKNATARGTYALYDLELVVQGRRGDKKINIRDSNVVPHYSTNLPR